MTTDEQKLQYYFFCLKLRECAIPNSFKVLVGPYVDIDSAGVWVNTGSYRTAIENLMGEGDIVDHNEIYYEWEAFSKWKDQDPWWQMSKLIESLGWGLTTKPSWSCVAKTSVDLRRVGFMWKLHRGPGDLECLSDALKMPRTRFHCTERFIMIDDSILERF